MWDLSEREKARLIDETKGADKSRFCHPEKWIRDLISGVCFFLSAIFFENGNLSIRHVRTLLHYNCRQLGAVQAEWT